MRNKNKILSVVVICLVAMSALSNVAFAAFTSGGSVGPVNPDNGYPNWYMDQNGLALEQCLEPNNPKCVADPVIVGNPLSEQLGFGGEAFYWNATALMDSKKANGTAGRALAILALENAWINGDPAPGEQMVFARLRLFIDVPAAGRYRITHPFGSAFFDVSPDRIAATGGIRAINVNLLGESGFDAAASTNIPLGDVGCAAAPCDFSLALQGGIGPFLTWDTFDLNPALSDPILTDVQTGKRYVGDPLVDHRIKGSPLGTNIFRVQGPAGVDLNPNLAGVQDIIETDLFSVNGRLAVVDTVPPVVQSTSPAEVVVDSLGQAANVVLSANITDDIGVRSATIDLGPLGNTFTSTINGAQEVPSTIIPASGSGNFTIDTAANTLSFNINFSGLSSAETSAHIHGPAATGANAPILFTLPPGAVKNGIWNYPENLEADILAGRTYVNIHSLLFPNGEIRGQILPEANVQNMILTTGTLNNGTWSVLVPSITRLGTFNLPLTANDGSNVTNFNFSLSVVNPAPVTNLDSATIGTGIGEEISIEVLLNDADPNGNLPLSLESLQNINPPGAAVITPDRLHVLVTSPSAAFAGQIKAQYTVADSLGATSTGDIAVNVVRPVLTSINVSPVSVSMSAGQTRQFTAVTLDQFGQPITAAVIWSVSNPFVGSIDANGLLSALADGQTTVTASSSSGIISGAANITVGALTCQTRADIDGNGIISNLEIFNHVRAWKAGAVSNLEILSGIRFWKAGAGC